jgi:hypothetical protein
LPALREVYIVKHLRSAESRLGAARLAVDSRRRLSELLHVALSQAETRLRDSLRPRIGRALDQVELRPANVPETVARSKLIEELLDTVVDRGFLTLGDLRDAISRNNLKIRDLTDWREAMAGDQLLETDKRLAELLDGVYRRGELYRRIPQALSSLAFGTPRGRALTRYGFVPYGGAFLLVAFYDYVLHELRVISGFGFLDTLVRSIVGHSAAPGEPPPEPLQMSTVLIGAVQIVVLGTFLLGMLYNPEFRARVIDWSRTAWKGLKFALFELPTRLLEMPAVQAILNSRAYQFFRRFVFKPLLLTLLLLSVKRISTGEPLSWLTWLITFGSLNLLLNSRLGRNVDEMVTDWVVRGWHQLRMRVFAAALRLVIDIFSQMLDALERLLYAVDEWLRFRRGDSQLVTFVKAVLGAAWSVVTFVIRFCVTLLIEPQVNPIKHFPVVTVSHKIILPLGFPLVEMLAPHLGAAKANTLVWSTIWLIPGIFGFLVWELKENWRLFAANRPTRLEPVMIGSHGETMVRLLRPGFHSGTIPKLFARLRRADRKAYVTGQWAPARKLRDRLSHAVLEVRHFVERELIVLLEQTALWPPETWRVGGVDLGQRRIAVAIECRGERDAAASTSIEEPLMLVFEDRDGWLMASLGSPNWLSQFNSLQTEALSTALAGLLKLAGIQLRRDVLDDGCAERRLRFQLNEAGFVLRDAIGDQARYERDAAVANLLHPLGAAAEASRWPVFDQTRLYCGEAPISWARWVEAWHEPQRLLAETV